VGTEVHLVVTALRTSEQRSSAGGDPAHDTKGRTMTSVGTGRRSGQTLSGAAGAAGTQALRAAGMQLLATAGNQAVKVVLDQAVDRVDKMADRLDAVAAGDGRRRAAPSGTRDPRQDDADQPAAERPVRDRVGAAFGLVVDQALRLLRLVQRLAQQLAAALARLVRRTEEDSSDRTAGRSQDVDRAESSRGTAVDERADDAGPAAEEAQPPRTSRREHRRATGQPESRRRQAAPPRSTRTRGHD
jgi:HPt (histidine-containing phosphotransfer) domain-containing protein